MSIDRQVPRVGEEKGSCCPESSTSWCEQTDGRSRRPSGPGAGQQTDKFEGANGRMRQHLEGEGGLLCAPITRHGRIVRRGCQWQSSDRVVWMRQGSHGPHVEAKELTRADHQIMQSIEEERAVLSGCWPADEDGCERHQTQPCWSRWMVPNVRTAFSIAAIAHVSANPGSYPVPSPSPSWMVVHDRHVMVRGALVPDGALANDLARMHLTA